MSLDAVKGRFATVNPVPIVSGDPRDRPIGKWLAGEHSRPDRPDTVLIGIPFDGATVVPDRKGAAGGPAAIRESLGELNCYSIPLDIDIADTLHGLDLGNIPVADSDSVTAVHDRVAEVLSMVLESGTIPVTVGGDDSLCFAAAQALCRATRGKVGVIGFDAHLDMRVLYSPESSSGSSYRRLFDELDGQIRPANTVHIGANGWFAAKEYGDYARSKGVALITSDDVYERGIDDVMKEAVARATKGTEAVYINFDMDVLDQHYAPGKVMRNPGGLCGRDAYRAARLVGENPKVKLFALNEVNSKRDVSSFTALVGASVIAYFWAGLAFRKRKQASAGRTSRSRGSRTTVRQGAQTKRR
jgi:formimidoylglutamase